MSNNATSDPKDSGIGDITFKSLILISVVVTAIQVISGYLIYVSLSNWNDRGSFGDMFGAVGTLFSGLAFAGVICAIFLQRAELKLQHNELEMTRQELTRSAEAQEKSEQALSDQVYLLAISNYLSVEVQRMAKYEEGSLSYQEAAERIARLEREVLEIIERKRLTQSIEARNFEAKN